MQKKISKKLEQSRRQTSRLWRHYRITKSHILSKKRTPLDIKRGLLREQKDITKQNISITWEDYRGYKFGAIHSSEYANFSYVKKVNNINTTQKWYKAKESFLNNYINIEANLDKQLDDILNEPGVRGVLLIFKIYNEEQERYYFASEYITRMLYDRLKNQDVSMFEQLSDKLSFATYGHDYEMKGIYIRVVYEKSKKE